ncbi:hypothetical protein JKP88DRAFT_352961 [Tribonema minus]|uniref:PIH1 domain-containing protein 1 n=1 Tax=Tribonema minus TaxID=303371 RepID=A0A835Z9R8_9STRA|nr:hypothetical protein JKP88DRAFT_352961 [Tribonema minus]
MARSMGIDIGQYGKQADGFWKMLDDLHASDPGAYDAYIKDTMEKAKAEEEARARPSFLPVPGYAIETTLRKKRQRAQQQQQQQQRQQRRQGGEEEAEHCSSLDACAAGTRVYVNVTSHVGIEPAQDVLRNALGDETPLRDSADGLQVPLLVSPLRPATSGGGGGVAVDVVVHPWVLRCCLASGTFLAMLTELALQWVEAERGGAAAASTLDHKGPDAAQLDRRWRVVEGRAYVHGGGGDGGEPLRFPLEGAAAQSRPPSQRSAAAAAAAADADLKGSSSGSGGGGRSIDTPAGLLAAMACDGSGGGSAPAAAAAARSGEGSVLQSLGLQNVGSSGGKSAMEVRMPGQRARSEGDKGAKGRSGPIIEEVGAGAGKGGGAKRAGNGKPVVKKGFLTRTVKEELYPQGSSEGQPVGTYEKFMSRCKTKRATAAAAPPADDPEFNALLEAADPDLQQLFSSKDDDDSADPLFGHLQQLAGILGGLGGGQEASSTAANTKKAAAAVASGARTGSTGTERAPLREHNSGDGNTRASAAAAGGATNAAPSAVLSTAGGGETAVAAEGHAIERLENRPAQLRLLSHSLREGPAGLVVSVALGEAAQRSSEAQLDISEQCLRLQMPGCAALEVPFPFAVNAAAAKAKFSAKRRELRVEAPRS